MKEPATPSPDAAPAVARVPVAAPVATPVETPVKSPLETGPTVPVPLPLSAALCQATAFALSALLSPYLVIPAGTVGIVASVAYPPAFALWVGLSVFFSTGVPALYVLCQIWRGKITDVHVMEREQRGGPFLVAVLSSALGAWVLFRLNAPRQVWGIGMVLSLNGVVLNLITHFWKISMHVAVLSATLLATFCLIPDIDGWRLVWMVPALIWARVTRGRHSVWQGIAACTISSLLTGAVLYGMKLWTPGW